MGKAGKITLGVVGAVVVIGVISSLSGGGSSNSGKGQADATQTNTAKPTPAKKNNTTTQKKGHKPNDTTVGNWKIIGQPSVKNESFDHTFALELRVQNTSSSDDQPFITATFLNGNKILGTADCNAGNTKPNQIVTLNCISTDKYKPWKTIEYQNSF